MSCPVAQHFEAPPMLLCAVSLSPSLFWTPDTIPTIQWHWWHEFLNIPDGWYIISQSSQINNHWSMCILQKIANLMWGVCDCSHYHRARQRNLSSMVLIFNRAIPFIAFLINRATAAPQRKGNKKGGEDARDSYDGQQQPTQTLDHNHLPIPSCRILSRNSNLLF